MGNREMEAHATLAFRRYGAMSLVFPVVLGFLAFLWFGLAGQSGADQPGRAETSTNGTPPGAQVAIPVAIVDAELVATSSAVLTSTPSLTLSGEAGYFYFGFRLTNIGDTDGDGYDDLVTAVEGYPPLRGRFHVFRGRPNGRNVNGDQTIVGPNPATVYFGASIAAGDFDGDGVRDVVAGDSSFDDDRGRVLIYRGGSAGLGSVPMLTLTRSAGEWFGLTVIGLGDVNGDHFDDLAICAPGPWNSYGRVYVYFGTASGPASSPAYTVTGSAGHSYKGRMVGDGDFNGDGFRDWVLPEDGSVEITVRYGGLGAMPPTSSITLNHSGTNWGTALGPLGDINGDGFTDLAVADHSRSSVYIFLGGPGGLTTVPVMTLTGSTAQYEFGFDLSLGGDANGDGFADLAVGKRTFSGSDPGMVLVYLGGEEGLAPTPALTLTGTEEEPIGASLAFVGNALNANCDDLYVGVPGALSSAGRAYEFACVNRQSTFLPWVVR